MLPSKVIQLLFILIIAANGQVNPNDIKHVHLVLSNHFDAGFALAHTSNDTAYVVRVINLYFDEHFPLMVKNALYFRGSNVSYVYTTQPWLVYLYFHCEETGIPSAGGFTAHCPTKSQLDAFEDCIKRGEITWHAFPFNSQLETLNSEMASLSIQLVHSLDQQFGVNKKNTLSQRDVPGIPAGMIGTLLDNGIVAVSVGVNGGSAAPSVPKVFRWQHPLNTSLEVLAMWHAGGYGGYSLSDMVFVDGWDHALGFYWLGDNQGPGQPSELIAAIKEVQKQFPNAVVQPVSFDTYVNLLQTVRTRLPIVRNEIGDTWVHGVSSDPIKTQKWRELQRSLGDIITKPNILESSQVSSFIALVVKLSEHTWGVDFKTYLNDTTNWNNEQFDSVRNGVKYQKMISSWVDQRNYLDAAIKQMDSTHPIREMIEERFKNLEDKKTKYIKAFLSNKNSFVHSNVDWQNQVITCGNWQFSIGSLGDINYLRSINTGRLLFDNQHTIQFSQTTYTYDDVMDFVTSYGFCKDCPYWYIEDFGKPGMDKAQTFHGEYFANPQSVSQIGPYEYVVVMTMKPNLYGTPSDLLYYLDFSDDKSVGIELLWYNKTATRLPESFWVSFTPIASDSNGFYIDKVGSLTPALSSVVNGTMHLNGHWKGVSYNGNDGSFSIDSLDTGVVAIGLKSPFPTPFQKPNPLDGIHYNAFNNIWDTNYPLWYPYLDEDASMLFRFVVTINK